MTPALYVVRYSLPGEKMAHPLKVKGKHHEVGLLAVASWKYHMGNVAYDTFYWSNIGVNDPFQLLNDSNNNPIWVVTADFSFSHIGWRYVGDGEVITDFCGKRGQIDGSNTCPKTNAFQLVPALREKGGDNVCFVNNACYAPARVDYATGGRLMVIPNDSYYDDNSGSFDVSVTVIKYLP